MKKLELITLIEQTVKRLIEENEDTSFFAAVAVILNGKKVLMGKAIANDDRNGKIVFPGGHIDGNETPQQAAEREAREETGVTVKSRNLPIFFDVPEKKIEGKSNRRIAFIVCDYVNGDIKNNEEFEYLKWFPIDNLPLNDVYPQNIKLIKMLRNRGIV